MATLEPGQAALFIGPAPDCQVVHTDHRNSLCVIVAIEPERDYHDGHTVLCRAQDGTLGYARPDELRPFDDWGIQQAQREVLPEAVSAELLV